MINLVKAKQINVPHDLAEKLDKLGGRKEGELRNILVDAGKARDIEEETFAVALGFEVQAVMEAPKGTLPGAPMSAERFSDLLFVVSTAYLLGTMHFEDDGKIKLGHLKDIQFFDDAMSARELEFRSGKKISARIFAPVLELATSQEQVKSVYKDIRSKLFKKNTMSPLLAVKVAKLIIRTGKNLETSDIWDR